MKKTISLLLVFVLTLSLFACQGGNVTCERHVDVDEDGICDVCNDTMPCKRCKDSDKDAKCDVCGKNVSCKSCIDVDKNAKCDVCGNHVDCTTCVDADKNAKCDVCGNVIPCTECTDGDSDEKCDVCGKDLTVGEHICVTETPDGICDICEKYIEHEHLDKNGSGKCYICSKNMPVFPTQSYGPVPWKDEAPIELVFQMTKNSNGAFASGSERYLSGEASERQRIDDLVSIRNTNAEHYTNVNVTYDYLPNTNDYDWGDSIKYIANESTADIHSNYIYDMVGAAMLGAFANLRNTTRDVGNFFAFNDKAYDEKTDNKGYMYGYMEAATLNSKGLYILASDYFIDTVRAMNVVPVNIDLLTKTGSGITGDLDRDGKFTVNDFYQEIKENKWTFEKLIAYSASVFRDTGNISNKDDIADTLGFFVSSSDVNASEALLYSYDTGIIKKEMNPETGNWDLTLVSESEELYGISDAITNLFGESGIYSITSFGDYTDTGYKSYGNTQKDAAVARFADSKILLGGIVPLNELETESYEGLISGGILGVAPVPLYRDAADGENFTYLTTLKNNARVGAIDAFTEHFSACTAFLDYQSISSEDVLNEYYTSVIGGSDKGASSLDMIKYIRSNARGSLDKAVADSYSLEPYAYNPSYNVNANWARNVAIYGFNYDIRFDYYSYRPEMFATIEEHCHYFRQVYEREQEKYPPKE